MGARTGDGFSGGAFIGRTPELDVLTAAAQAAAAGRPSFVWIEGAAGSGKTTLVRRTLAELPDGFQTVWAQGEESAMDIPYALGRELGIETAEGAFAAGQALLEAWADRQEQGPVVVIVEDLHWSDPESAQGLLSAVRHLDGDHVLVIITTRPEANEGWDRLRRDGEQAHELFLSPFTMEEVARLASTRGIELGPRQAARLAAHTGGQPLWTHTLLTELSADELQGPGDLPAPRSLASAVTARLSEIPEPGRDLAAALAVINQRSPLALVGRVAGIGHPLEPFEALLATGFVDWRPREPGSPVEFLHPLYRQAVYDDLSPTRRRDLHRSAAGVLTPAAVLAHRVAAADGSDDGLADELEGAAAAERSGGAIALAARNLLWASSLSETTERSERLLVEAALAFLDAGQSTRAAFLRSRIEACPKSPARSLALGMIAWELGEAAEAERWLSKVVETEPKSGVAPTLARAWAQLAELYVVEGRAAEAARAADHALELAEYGTSAERLAWIHRSFAEGILNGGAAGLVCLNERLSADPEQVPSHEVDMLATRATIAYYAARPSLALDDLDAVFGLARRGFVPVQLARCHYLTSAILTSRGGWDDALVEARTALSIANDNQLVWMQSQCNAVLGTLLAYRGDWEAAERHVARAVALAAGQQNLEAIGTARLASAALGRARDQPDRVISELTALSSTVPRLATLAFWPWLIDALIDTNRLNEADDHLRRLAETAAAWQLGLEARLLLLRARLATASSEADRGEELFEAALAQLGADDPLLDRALARHWYGRLLQARGQRRQAIDQLRAAHELLTAVGAKPFVERVELDLAATGLPSQKTSQPGAGQSRSVLDLTDRERDIATLVAQGLSNPEVAARLYVSRKTVEFHLRNIYGKLAVSSRRELRDRRLFA